MIKIEQLKLHTLFVVFLSALFTIGTAHADGAVSGVSAQEDPNKSIDDIVEATQEQVSKLSENIQSYQIQAEREKKLAESLVRAATEKVTQARLEMSRAQNLLSALSLKQGASINIADNRSVDDIASETQKQVAQLTVTLQRLKIEAERERKAAESKVNQVQLKINQLLREKTRVQAFMNQLSPESLSDKRVEHSYSRHSHSTHPASRAYQFFDDVLFAKDKSNLTYIATAKINNIANFLVKNPEKHIVISGHADQNGKHGYNLNLSQRRAKEVFYALLEKGVRLEQIQVSSFGDTRPKIPSKSRDSSTKNRRVEFMILN